MTWRTNRYSSAKLAGSNTQPRPASCAGPSTSIASARIVPGEPSGSSHEQQYAVPSLERLRREQPSEQRMRPGDDFDRQNRTKMLQSVALIPGTGKTHLLIALATADAQQGFRVRYSLATKLMNELEAADKRQLTRMITRYSRVD
jgi:IstB-like ATP binding protein